MVNKKARTSGLKDFAKRQVEIRKTPKVTKVKLKSTMAPNRFEEFIASKQQKTKSFDFKSQLALERERVKLARERIKLEEAQARNSLRGFQSS